MSAPSRFYWGSPLPHLPRPKRGNQISLRQLLQLKRDNADAARKVAAAIASNPSPRDLVALVSVLARLHSSWAALETRRFAIAANFDAAKLARQKIKADSPRLPKPLKPPVSPST